MVGSHDGLMLVLGVASEPWIARFCNSDREPTLLNLTRAVMGKMTACPIQHIVKTFPMLPAHRMDYLPTPIQR